MSERGSGTVVALGILAAILSVSLVMVNVANRALEQTRLNAMADNAAVAAADALRGLVAGYPCEVAKQLAPVTHCEIVDSDVLVEVAKGDQTAKARAGEPG